MSLIPGKDLTSLSVAKIGPQSTVVLFLRSVSRDSI